MKRLGKNLGCYGGETIDIQSILRSVEEEGRRYEWQAETLPVARGLELLALRKPNSAGRRRIYLSTGIHGDEPAGPLAIQELMQLNHWPEDAAVWLCPCLNPYGFAMNRRENVDGLDLNRDYQSLKSLEIRAHVAWLEKQPDFDLCICLHEDWESCGFYVYELNPDHRASAAEKVIAAVAHVCPIDESEIIEGRPARQGIIRPDLFAEQRPLWPEALYLIQHKTRLSYTLEAPSDYPLGVRVSALITAVRTLLGT